MNTLPVAKGLFTRFMGGSASVFDYGLIDSDHVNTVTSFVIDEDARYDCGSDHALLLAQMKFGRSKWVEWSFKETVRFNFNSTTNFKAYQNEIDNHSSGVPLHVFDDMSADEKLNHITSSIVESGKKTLGIKLKRKRIIDMSLYTLASEHVCVSMVVRILYVDLSPKWIPQLDQ